MVPSAVLDRVPVHSDRGADPPVLGLRSPAHAAHPVPVLRELRAGREDRRERVVLTARQHETAGGVHSLPLRGAEYTDGFEESGIGPQRLRLQFHAHPARPADVSQVLDQSVAHVEHGGRAQPGRLRARGVGRARPAVLGQALLRALDALFQQRQPRGGQSEVPGVGDHVTRPGPVTADRRAPLQVAEGGDGDGEGVRTDHVTADHRSAGQRALVAHPEGELLRPGQGELGGCGEPDEQPGGTGAHGRDVGVVLRDRAVPDVPGAGPLPSEVAALDEEVRGRDRAPVGRGHDRGVVAGAEDYIVRPGELARHACDQSELAKTPNGAQHRDQGTVTLRRSGLDPVVEPHVRHPFVIGCALLVFSAIIVTAQVTPSTEPEKTPRPPRPQSPLPRRDETPLGSFEEELRAKRAIKLAEKEHEENLNRARQVAELAKQLQIRLKDKSAIDRDSVKKLERLEKLTKKIRSEAGGQDEEVKIVERPADITAAVDQLAESAESLAKEVQNTPRQVVSASVIGNANHLLELIKLLRGFDPRP